MTLAKLPSDLQWTKTRRRTLILTGPMLGNFKLKAGKCGGKGT
jgi:hypothetical protein